MANPHRWAGLRRPLVVLVVLVLVAASCGGDGDGGAGGGGERRGEGAEALPECPVDALEDRDPAADGKVEVTVWHTFVAKFADTLQALTDEYNASQDMVEVRLESQGDSNEALIRTYTEAIPTGDLPDVVIADDPNTEFLYDSGTVLPAQACFDAAGQSLDEFLPTPVAYYTIDGVMQPGMLTIGSTLMYYNREHFTQAGLDPDDPPGTLDEMRDAAQAIKDAGVVDMPIVLALQPFIIEFWLTGGGYPVVNEDNGRGAVATAGAFDNEGALEIYEWIAEMEEDGLLQAIPDVEGTINHFLAMGRGQASMLPDTSSAATSVAAFLRGDLETDDVGTVDTSGVDVQGLDIDAAPFPGLDESGLGQVGGQGWYLVAGKSDQVTAAAWDYFTFMNRVESQVTWNIEGSYTPWLAAAFDDPRLQEFWASGRLGSWLGTAAEQVRNIDPDFPGPLIGPYLDVRQAIRSSLDRLVLENQSPQDAVRSANEEITDAVARYEDENF